MAGEASRTLTDAEPAARARPALMSDWFPATTGEVVHVDGGLHAVGAWHPADGRTRARGVGR